jgi:GTP pyrophosphokinase
MTGSSALPTSPTTAAGHAAAASFAALTAELDYLLPSDIDNVRRAYRFADEAHLGQLRKNGDPYITHPIAVAAQCAQWKLDAQTLMAALMHDAMEDCGITKENLIERFGVPVAELVDGLTKLEKLDYHTREQNQAESFRKMLLAMSRDVRVILIKIADRLHNMRTMGDMPRNKWGRISQETLDIYAPMAHRLGLNVAFRELQDLAFKHRYPWRYSVLQKAVNHSRTSRRDVIQRVIAETRNALSAQGLHAQVQGREKTLYSIFRKMREKHLELKEVHDRYGVRVVVETNLQCYTTVGVLHQLYKPATIKFKDYIALPKDNGYQSLHTTVRGPFNADIEFQIRTNAMNVVAESGVAAHWLYKASAPDSDTAHRLGTKWLQSLMEIQQETGESSDFLHNVRVDLLPDSLYVNTPKGRVISLPRGATAVDFAYAVHSDIGNKAVAATVNGERVPLRTELKNGDVVDISTEPAQRPDPAWLSFVRTGRARSKIRHHLKALAYADARVLGEKIFLQALRTEGIAVLPAVDGPYRPCWDKLLRFTGNRLASDLLADIGMGKHIAGMVGKKFATLLGEAGLKPDVVLITMPCLKGSSALMGVKGHRFTMPIVATPFQGIALWGIWVGEMG